MLESIKEVTPDYASGITLAPEVIAKTLGFFADLCSFQMGGVLS
jgi:hypothetical protein